MISLHNANNKILFSTHFRLLWIFLKGVWKKTNILYLQKTLNVNVLFLSDHPLVVCEDGCIGELPDRHQLPIGVEGPHSQTAEPAVLLQRKGFNIWKLTLGSKVTFSTLRPVLSKYSLIYNYSYLCFTFFSLYIFEFEILILL